MSDSNNDWIEEELANLSDMEAPATLLPKVMERVRTRCRHSFRARIFDYRAALSRSFVLALSACLLTVLAVVSPAQYFSALPIASAVLKVIQVLLESTRIVLLQTKVYHVPLLTLLVPVVILSYTFLVTTASVIKRLLTLRK